MSKKPVSGNGVGSGVEHEHPLEAIEEAQELLEGNNLQEEPKASGSIEAHIPRPSELNSEIDSDGFSPNS